jgi:hypothetical protein
LDLTRSLQGWAQALVNWIDWVAPQIPIVLGKLAEFGQGIWNWLTGTAIPTAQQNLTLLAARFYLWFSENDIPGKVQAQLGEWLSGILAWFGAAIPQLIQAALDWANSLLDNLFPKPGQAEAKGDDWFAKLIAWGIEQLPKLVEMSNQWAAEFLNWIEREVLPVLVPRLTQISREDDPMGQSGRRARHRRDAEILDRRLPQLDQRRDRAAGERAQRHHHQYINWVNSQIGTVVAQGARIGSGIVGGIRSGIADAWAGIAGWFTGLIAGLIQAGLDALRNALPGGNNNNSTQSLPNLSGSFSTSAPRNFLPGPPAAGPSYRSSSQPVSAGGVTNYYNISIYAADGADVVRQLRRRGVPIGAQL